MPRNNDEVQVLATQETVWQSKEWSTPRELEPTISHLCLGWRGLSLKSFITEV